jgi:hypothetical protein
MWTDSLKCIAQRKTHTRFRTWNVKILRQLKLPQKSPQDEVIFEGVQKFRRKEDYTELQSPLCNPTTLALHNHLHYYCLFFLLLLRVIYGQIV